MRIGPCEQVGSQRNDLKEPRVQYDDIPRALELVCQGPHKLPLPSDGGRTLRTVAGTLHGENENFS